MLCRKTILDRNEIKQFFRSINNLRVINFKNLFGPVLDIQKKDEIKNYLTTLICKKKITNYVLVLKSVTHINKEIAYLLHDFQHLLNVRNKNMIISLKKNKEVENDLKTYELHKEFLIQYERSELRN